MDSNVRTLYLFRAFPERIKLAEKHKWINLQVATSSPFIKSHNYHYVSDKGVHIWYSKTPFEGIPETAMQPPLSDGEHLVASHNSHYRQVWQGSKLMECYVIAAEAPDDSFVKINVDAELGWAIQREVVQWFSQPFTWYKALLGFSGLVFVWYLASWLTLVIQLNYIESETARLSEDSMEQIDVQTEMASKVEAYQFIDDWKGHGNLIQESFAVIASILEDNIQWSLMSLNVDNDLVQLEFKTENSDFTNIIPQLEETGRFSNIKIRPLSQTNTWMFEGVAL